MNYDQPRQRADGSGWHYTRRNDEQTWPLGYCRDHPPHATEQEARECYGGYLLAERLDLHGSTDDAWRQCKAPQGCTALANRWPTLDGWAVAPLCDIHRTRETVAALRGTAAGDSIHS